MIKANILKSFRINILAKKISNTEIKSKKQHLIKRKKRNKKNLDLYHNFLKYKKNKIWFSLLEENKKNKLFIFKFIKLNFVLL